MLPHAIRFRASPSFSWIRRAACDSPLVFTRQATLFARFEPATFIRIFLAFGPRGVRPVIILSNTGHPPGAVPGFRPSPGNSEETTTRVLTEEISVLFRVPTWDPTHPGSPVSRALPGNTPTQGPTREGKPGFFLGGGGNPGRNPGHGLGKTRERGPAQRREHQNRPLSQPIGLLR